MGLFNLFKKAAIVQDDFFGELRFLDFKDSSKNYFEGKGYFEPTNSETEYLIFADINGPTERQKDFYKKIQSSFSEYVEKINPLIEEEFRSWKEDFMIKEFNKEFNLVCITIQRHDIVPLIWDMAFTTIHDLDHNVTIEFVDNEPKQIQIDG